MLTRNLIKFRHMLATSKIKFDTQKDYYKILEIQATATQEAIKKQYFQLAKIYHPDVNPKGTQQFSLIQEAYEILSNEEQRKEYDYAKNIGKCSWSAQKPYKKKGHSWNWRENLQKQQKMRQQWTKQFYQTNQDFGTQGKKEKPQKKQQQFERIQRTYSGRNPMWSAESAYRLKLQRQAQDRDVLKDLKQSWTKWKKKFRF